jgi:hypothetical protein
MLRNPVGVEKGTKAVILANFSVCGEPAENALKWFFNTHSAYHSQSSYLR